MLHNKRKMKRTILLWFVPCRNLREIFVSLESLSLFMHRRFVTEDERLSYIPQPGRTRDGTCDALTNKGRTRGDGVTCVRDGNEKPTAQGWWCNGARTCNVQPDPRHEGHAQWKRIVSTPADLFGAQPLSSLSRLTWGAGVHFYHCQ
jgi:hypothetical protein